MGTLNEYPMTRDELGRFVVELPEGRFVIAGMDRAIMPEVIAIDESARDDRGMALMTHLGWRDKGYDTGAPVAVLIERDRPEPFVIPSRVEWANGCYSYVSTRCLDLVAVSPEPTR